MHYIIYSLGVKSIKFESNKETIIHCFFPFYNFRDWSLVPSWEIRDSCRDLKSVTYHLHPRVPFDVSRSTPATHRRNSTVEKMQKIPATDSDGGVCFVWFTSLSLIEIVEIRYGTSDIFYGERGRLRGSRGRARNGKLRLHPSSCSRRLKEVEGRCSPTALQPRRRLSLRRLR